MFKLRISPLRPGHTMFAFARSFSQTTRRCIDDNARREAFYQGMRRAKQQKDRKYITSLALYSGSVIIGFLALAYAAVPLYRVLCQRTGFSGVPITDGSKFTPDRMVPVDRKQRIRVTFSSEVSSIMPWKFKPQQREVSVLPGETALAFYKAENKSDKDIIGMATYSVIPERAAPYFSKIQCFCFEEQMLRAGEEVDMPVFFFIDPDFASDPALVNVDEIILHYTFFKAKYDDNGKISPVPQGDQSIKGALVPDNAD